MPIPLDLIPWLAIGLIAGMAVLTMLYAWCSRGAYEIGVHELRRRVAHLCYDREMQVLRLSVGDEALEAVRNARRPAAKPQPADVAGQVGPAEPSEPSATAAAA